jgi:hypothetical protein
MGARAIAKKNGRKTAAKTAVAKIAQPHGGALYSGGVPGNAGGLGRAPSAIRAKCRGSFEQRIPILEQIADGEPSEEVRVPLALVLRHAKCPRCEGVLEAKDVAQLALVTVKGKGSPKARDRIQAISELGDFGMDSGRMDAEDIRARLATTVEILQSELDSEDAERVLARIEALWVAA